MVFDQVSIAMESRVSECDKSQDRSDDLDWKDRKTGYLLRRREAATDPECYQGCYRRVQLE